MNEVNIHIVVNVTYEATHYWRDCDIASVMYLKHPHRHLFYIKCMKNVSHGNRDIEIIKFKRQIVNYLDTKYMGDFGGKSCEHIGEELLRAFNLSMCQVLEDNENGAIVTL